jgi:iron complex outermembrane receptor protein
MKIKSFPLPRAAAPLALGLMALTGHALGQGASPAFNALKQLSVEQLMDIEVTSVSRRPEKLSDTASAIHVVTGDDIRRSGASSLPEALRLADNLDVAQKNSHDWGISARGFNTELANKLLVMIDGRTVYTPLFSGVIWDVQDYLLEDIDRIEVISGPGGTLWGANAVNGVINVITRSARDTPGLYLDAGAGSGLRGSAGARFGGTLAPGVYFRVYGKYSDRDEQVVTGGRAGADAWHKAQGGFRIDAEASPRTAFTLQGDLYGGSDQLATGGADQTSGGNVLGRWTHGFSDASHLSLQLYHDRTHLSEPVPALVVNNVALAPAGTFEDDLATSDLDFQHRFAVGGRNHVVWGLGYRFTHDRVTNAPALAFFPAQLDQHLLSGFAQDEFAIRKNLAFTAGTKLEHNDYTGLEVEPSVRLQWSPTATQGLWAAVSRAVRRPSRIDRDLSEGAPPYFVLLAGGANFTSEKVTAYELGHRAQLGPTLATSLALFYNDYDDVRSTALNPRTVFPLFFENNLEGETHGFELSADFQALPSWRLHAGYSLLREHLHIKPGRTDFNQTLNETSDPGQHLTLRSSVDFPGSVEFDAGLRWIDARPVHSGPTPGSLPGYVELDVRLGCHPRSNLELSLVGQNLLHDHHPEYGFPGPARGEIQRSVYGKAVWRF